MAPDPEAEGSQEKDSQFEEASHVDMLHGFRAPHILE
jgi:hypothetical protein